MKRLVAFLILGASLTACSSTRITPPSCEVPEALGPVAELQGVPEMPIEVASTDTTATYNLEGLLQLQRLRKASTSNKTVGDLNSAALQVRNDEINSLIECVRHQNIWMEVREEMLEQERKAHLIDNYWHRGVILLIGAGVLL